ncbi:MAG: M20/M25/M40 family metallo-hydrolase [Clostridia bacterium]|nr:M20/M25/M40 family metallo-hydrolase [Clostridia bacterium]
MLSLKDFILSLCSVSTVSGTELLADDSLFPSDLFDKVEKDDIGNRYFYKYSARDNAPLLMIDAHFDEVGLVVSEILENGFLRVVTSGQPDMRALPAAPLIVHGKEDIFAVAASTPPHLRSINSENKLITPEELLIDTGLTKERARELIRVGDRISYAKSQGNLLNGKFYAQGLDNKSTVAIALYTVSNLEKELMPYNVCVVLSAKEEGGCVGARLAAKRISPDAAIVLDVGFGASPDIDSKKCIAVDSGAAISYSSALDRPMTQNIVRIANKRGLQLQTIVENPAPGTNAEYIQFAAGVPAVLLSLPLYNMHTPVEVISMDDAESMSELLSAIITDNSLIGGNAK